MKSVVSRIFQRLLHLRFELGKFGVVGIAAYGLDTAITAALLWSGVEGYRAKIIATVIAATAAFLGNRFWTWRDRDRSGLAREYLLYFGFNLAGLGIQLASYTFTHFVLGAMWGIFATKLFDLISLQLIGNGFATIFRFWAYRRFVFIAPTPVEATR
ncbi:GtrA family protein [Catelliglobosispora koreensis]|uniref:GtrA family protein n=1 Tax=Catelliglobosispora koreensis TaxID=129052 RepID=UPI00036EF31D|nr:GtrA family protein [Catelliglobosispora koreensis]